MFLNPHLWSHFSQHFLEAVDTDSRLLQLAGGNQNARVWGIGFRV